MAQFKRIKRPVDGVFLLDKPLGYSSNQALQKVKWLYQAAKAGHTGSLDPLASGLLPICLGEATKFSHYLLDADKRYRALIRLGTTTTTGDAEGEVLATQPVQVTPADIQRALEQWTGDIEQVPPMYSALKHEGRKLYEYARQGVDILRVARPVTIHSIELHGYADHALDITVHCSKGTYIRTLAEDIGRTLGCGAHLGALRRTGTAHFDLAQSLTIEALEALPADARDGVLLPADAAIADLPKVVIDKESAFYLLRGQEIWKSGLHLEGLFRLYCGDRFLGTGRQTPEGRIAPQRLLVQRNPSDAN